MECQVPLQGKHPSNIVGRGVGVQGKILEKLSTHKAQFSQEVSGPFLTYEPIYFGVHTSTSCLRIFHKSNKVSHKGPVNNFHVLNPSLISETVIDSYHGHLLQENISLPFQNSHSPHCLILGQQFTQTKTHTFLIWKVRVWKSWFSLVLLPVTFRKSRFIL